MNQVFKIINNVNNKKLFAKQQVYLSAFTLQKNCRYVVT